MDRFERAWRRGHNVLFGDDYERDDGRCRLGPEWLVLVINNFCNLRCKMCDVGLGESNTVFYDHLIGDDPQNMSLDLLETILAQAADFFPRPGLRFSYTLTDENYTHMVDFVHAIEGLDPAGINFSHLNFITEEMAAAHNARYDGELAMSRSNLGTMNLDAIDLDEMWRGLQALKRLAASRPGLPSITIVPDFDDPAGLETFYRQPTTFVGGRNCTDPWRMAMIRSDGTIIPAHGRCYNVPIGNVTTTPLPALWNNQRFRTFRQTLHAAGGALPACARCCGVIGK